MKSVIKHVEAFTRNSADERSDHFSVEIQDFATTSCVRLVGVKSKKKTNEEIPLKGKEMHLNNFSFKTK